MSGRGRGNRGFRRGTGAVRGGRGRGRGAGHSETANISEDARKFISHRTGNIDLRSKIDERESDIGDLRDRLRERSSNGDSLMSRLYGQPVQVVGCQIDWDCGIAVVHHDNPVLPKPLFCMFLITDLTHDIIQPHDIVGIDIVVDAVLLDAVAPVPYLAKRVCYPKHYRQVPETLIDAIEPNQVAIDTYDLYANRLYDLVMKNDSIDERQTFRNFSISTTKRRSFTSRSRSKSPHQGRRSRSPLYNHEGRRSHSRRSHDIEAQTQSSRDSPFHMLRRSFDHLASSSQEDLQQGYRDRHPSDERRYGSFERRLRRPSADRHHISRYDEFVRDDRRRRHGHHDSRHDYRRDNSRHSDIFDGRERYSRSRSVSRFDRDQGTFDFEALQRRDTDNYENQNDISFEYNEDHRVNDGYNDSFHYDQEREDMSPRSPQRWGSYDNPNYGYTRSRSRSGSYDYNERRYSGERSPFDSRDHSLRRSRSHSDYNDMSPRPSRSYVNYLDSRSNSLTRRSRSRSVYDSFRDRSYSRSCSQDNFGNRRYSNDNNRENFSHHSRSLSRTDRDMVSNSQQNSHPARYSVKRSRSQSENDNRQVEKHHKVFQSNSVKQEPADMHDHDDIIVIPNEKEIDLKPIASASKEGLAKDNIILRIDNVKNESKAGITSPQSDSSKMRNKEQPKERSRSPLRDPDYHKEVRRSKQENDAKLSAAGGIRKPYEREQRPVSRDRNYNRSHNRGDKSNDRRRDRSRERRNIKTAADKELEALNKEIKELQSEKERLLREKKKEKLNQELQKRLNELAKLEKEDEGIKVGRKNNKDDRHRGKGSRRDDRRRMDRHPPSKHREKPPTRPGPLLNYKKHARICLWNVKTMYEQGRAELITKEFIKNNIDILGVTESQWLGSGESKHSSGVKILYSGHNNLGLEHKQGVALLLSTFAEQHLLAWKPLGPRMLEAFFKTAEKDTELRIILAYAPNNSVTQIEKDIFFQELKVIYLQGHKENNITLFLGDLDAVVGGDNTDLEHVMGKHGLGTINDNGAKLIKFCVEHDLTIGGTMYRHTHKGTLKSSDQLGEESAQVDHICISSAHKSCLRDVRVKKDADVLSDHYLLLAELIMKRVRREVLVPAVQSNSSVPVCNDYTAYRIQFDDNDETAPQVIEPVFGRPLLDQEQPAADESTTDHHQQISVRNISPNQPENQNSDNPNINNDSNDAYNELVPESSCSIMQTGVIRSYMNPKIGVITTKLDNDNTRVVVFHISQLWCWNKETKTFFPFLEYYATDGTKDQFPPDLEVKYYMQTIAGTGEYSHQAVCVWQLHNTGGETPPFRNLELTDTLQYILEEIKYFLTGELPKEVKFTPLGNVMETAEAGRIQEYITPELGLIRLEGKETVALFHLEEVWSPTSLNINCYIPYKEVQTGLMQEYLPIGSPVFIAARPLTCSPNSTLRYQAVVVWKRLPTEPQTFRILEEFTAKHNTMLEKEIFEKTLDLRWDWAKDVWGLQYSLNSELFLGVPVALNYLPFGWAAVVSHALDNTLGLIKIFKQDNSLLYGSCQQIFAVFHIDSAFSSSGTKIVEDGGMFSRQLLGYNVDLVARSIYDSNEKSLHAFQQLLDSVGAGNTPILQAVYVYVKPVDNESDGSNSTTAAGNNFIPRATSVREDFATVNSLSPKMYLSPYLRILLDTALVRFHYTKLNLPNVDTDKLIMPKAIDEPKLLAKLKKINCNGSDRFTYGRFERRQLVDGQANLLPENVSATGVNIVYIHRRKFFSDSGVVEFFVKLKNGEEVPVYGFFMKHQLHQFQQQQFNDSDLPNLLPVHQHDVSSGSGSYASYSRPHSKFAAHATLTLPGTQIPYTITKLWNDEVRVQTGAAVPLPDLAILKFRHLFQVICSITGEDFENSRCINADNVTPKTNSKGKIRIIDVTKDMLQVSKAPSSIATKHFATLNGSLIASMKNISGEVEKIINDHIAVISFNDPLSRVRRRALCTWHDVFCLDWSRPPLTTVSQVYQTTAYNKGFVLPQVLSVKMKVTFDAVPVVPVMPNLSDIFYAVTGCIIGDHNRSLPPLQLQTPCTFIAPQFLAFYKQVIGLMDESLEIPAHALSNLKVPPEKFSKRDIRGSKSRLSVRPDYHKKPLTSIRLLQGEYGRVLRLIKTDYGIGCCRLGDGKAAAIQFLFTVHDFTDSSSSLLSQRVKPNDFIVFNAVRVESVEANDRNLDYVATRVATSPALEDLRGVDITTDTNIKRGDVPDEKIANFRTVLDQVLKLEYSQEEKDLAQTVLPSRNMRRAIRNKT